VYAAPKLWHRFFIDKPCNLSLRYFNIQNKVCYAKRCEHERARQNNPFRQYFAPLGSVMWLIKRRETSVCWPYQFTGSNGTEKDVGSNLTILWKTWSAQRQMKAGVDNDEG
jgi:hypothetical protein